MVHVYQGGKWDFFFFFGEGGAKFGAVSAVTGSPL